MNAMNNMNNMKPIREAMLLDMQKVQRILNSQPKNMLNSADNTTPLPEGVEEIVKTAWTGHLAPHLLKDNGVRYSPDKGFYSVGEKAKGLNTIPAATVKAATLMVATLLSARSGGVENKLPQSDSGEELSIYEFKSVHLGFSKVMDKKDKDGA